MVISEATQSKTLIFEFFDSAQNAHTKFTLNQNIALHINLNASIATDQYMNHTECLKVHHDHVVLICVEKLQTDGFVVKMHDLKLI